MTTKVLLKFNKCCHACIIINVEPKNLGGGGGGEMGASVPKANPPPPVSIPMNSKSHRGAQVITQTTYHIAQKFRGVNGFAKFC